MGTQETGRGATSVAARTSDMQVCWEEEGLTSPHAAALLAKIVEPGTSAAEHATFFAALA